MKSYRLTSGMLLATTMFVPLSAAVAQDTTPSITITDEIIVRGSNIPDPQRATSQVATFLNKEDLARTGDSNAALALTRLSGLSVVGGKFAYVRGLGDRYSSARLNGSTLPSPEPLKRTVPLDLFPSNILEGADVQKTFSVNYPAEFGGGTIDLRTVRDPGEDFLNVKLGVGVNTVTTAANGIFVNGGDLDFLGYDDGTRSQPSILASAIASGTSVNDLDPADIEALGEDLIDSSLVVLQRGNLGPDVSATVDGGLATDVFDGAARFGLVGVVGFSSGWTTETKFREYVSNDILAVEQDIIETTYTATTNGLGSASLEFDDHLVQGTLLYIHSSDKQAQITEGLEFDAGNSVVREEESFFLERTVGMGQIIGEHQLSDQLNVDWRTSFARSTRKNPYQWSFATEIQEDGAAQYQGTGQARFTTSDLTDDNVSAGIDVTYDLALGYPRQAEVSVGFDFSETDRIFERLNLQYSGGNSLPDETLEARPDALLSPGNIGSGFPSLFIREIEDGGATGSYAGDLTYRAGYAELDAELIPTLRTTVGVRYETSNQSVVPFNRFGVTAPGASINNDYWLPSATVTWNALDDLQLRAGYSRTIARPQFRELAPAKFFDPATDREFSGNRYLVDSEFDNYDIRGEYYLGRNQFVTLAGFYKDIENPIEEFASATSVSSFTTTFINVPSATLFGGEFEYRYEFLIGWNDWFDRRDWLFSVNYTYTNTEVEAVAGQSVFFDVDGGAATDAALLNIDGAPLQGTPEHIVNAQFGWQDEDDQLTVLLGWVDERILQRGNQAGSNRIDDIIEKPGIQLDVNYRQDIVLLGTDMTIGLSARNLLGTRHQEFQNTENFGRVNFDTYDRGRSLDASITARF